METGREADLDTTSAAELGSECGKRVLPGPVGIEEGGEGPGKGVADFTELTEYPGGRLYREVSERGGLGALDR